MSNWLNGKRIYTVHCIIMAMMHAIWGWGGMLHYPPQSLDARRTRAVVRLTARAHARGRRGAGARGRALRGGPTHGTAVPQYARRARRGRRDSARRTQGWHPLHLIRTPYFSFPPPSPQNYTLPLKASLTEGSLAAWQARLEEVERRARECELSPPAPAPAPVAPVPAAAPPPATPPVPPAAEPSPAPPSPASMPLSPPPPPPPRRASTILALNFGLATPLPSLVDQPSVLPSLAPSETTAPASALSTEKAVSETAPSAHSTTATEPSVEVPSKAPDVVLVLPQPTLPGEMAAQSPPQTTTMAASGSPRPTQKGLSPSWPGSARCSSYSRGHSRSAFACAAGAR